MSDLTTALLILGIVTLPLAIIALFYLIAAFRRISIVMKKVDYLVEDVTYKSEMLNSTVETIAKVSNYVDAFEVVAQKNIKSLVKIIVRNKEDIYKISNRIKDLAMGKAKKTKKSKNRRKYD